LPPPKFQYMLVALRQSSIELVQIHNDYMLYFTINFINVSINHQHVLHCFSEWDTVGLIFDTEERYELKELIVDKFVITLFSNPLLNFNTKTWMTYH
jgi:hypothetical protein